MGPADESEEEGNGGAWLITAFDADASCMRSSLQRLGQRDPPVKNMYLNRRYLADRILNANLLRPIL